MSQRFRIGGSNRPKKPCANPIFENWIMEWYEEATEKGTKMQYVYLKALKSLRKYPLVLSSGKECSILENFGTHMCKMIENRMVKEGMVPTEPPAGLDGVVELTAEAAATSKKPAKANASGVKRKKKVVDENGEDEDFDSDPPPPRRPQKQGKTYIPAFRSGPYAILMAFQRKEQEPDYRGYMTKTELMQEAQSFCDTSFAKPDAASSAHTAWSSMKSLNNKELVLKRGNPPQFFLSPAGRELAQKLAIAENGGNPLVGSNSEDIASDYGASSQDDEPEAAFIAQDVRMEPGSFEVVLYVDTCETNARSKAQEVVNELQKNGVTIYVQRLSVGDFVWVCRETQDMASNRNRLTMSHKTELMLPYVVERKRTDDLASSIRDGRYREQKHRLVDSKLRVVYLIESYGKGDHGLGEGALTQAMCSTQIVNGFHIQETTSIKDTCAYLTFMTRRLKKLYENKVLIGRHKSDYNVEDKSDNPNEAYAMFFSDFNDHAVKKTNWNVKEMFARQLMRMKGLSVDKAYAIIQKYPTVHDLFKAYSECANEKEKELLLSGLYFGNGSRKLGPSISRKVCYLYNNDKLS